MYVLENLFENTFPQEVMGSIKDSITNKYIDLDKDYYYDKISFETSDSAILISNYGNEKRKYYYFSGIDEITFYNTSDLSKIFRLDEANKAIRQPMALIFKSRYDSLENSVNIRYTTLGRGLRDIQDIAQFGFTGPLFHIKNDSMGILLYDLVFKME